MNKTINVEALLAKKEQISNAAIKSALSKLQKQKEEAQEAQLLAHLEVVQTNTKDAIQCLRDVRKKEKNLKAYLVAMATAEEAFYKDADFSKYQKDTNKAADEFAKAQRGQYP